MLLAVLPHVTFAASMLHGMGSLAVTISEPPAAAAHDHSGAVAAPAPCHEQASADQPAAAMKPPCCITGCGVIGLGPEIALPRMVAIGHKLGPPPTWSAEGAKIEPAERPPRPS